LRCCAHHLHRTAALIFFITALSCSSSSSRRRAHLHLFAIAFIIAFAPSTVFALSRSSSLLRRCAHLIIAPSSAQASLCRQALKLHCDIKRSSFIATSSAQALLRCQALKLHCALERSRIFNVPSSVQASLRRHALKLQASSRRGVLHFQAVMRSAFAFPTSSLYCAPLRTFEFQLTSASWFIGLFLVRSITYPSPFGHINLRRMLAARHIFKDI
jgi:hypothetical protein